MRFEGIDQVKKGLLGRFESTPDVHYSDLEHFVSGNCGMSRWLLTGTKVNGEKVRVRGCDFYTFKNGLVVRSRPKVLVGPCPQTKTTSSPSGNSFSLMERISVS